jgi:hypothetical protein
MFRSEALSKRHGNEVKPDSPNHPRLRKAAIRAPPPAQSQLRLAECPRVDRRDQRTLRNFHLFFVNSLFFYFFSISFLLVFECI